MNSRNIVKGWSLEPPSCCSRTCRRRRTKRNGAGAGAQASARAAKLPAYCHPSRLVVGGYESTDQLSVTQRQVAPAGVGMSSTGVGRGSPSRSDQCGRSRIPPELGAKSVKGFLVSFSHTCACDKRPANSKRMKTRSCKTGDGAENRSVKGRSPQPRAQQGKEHQVRAESAVHARRTRGAAKGPADAAGSEPRNPQRAWCRSGRERSRTGNPPQSHCCRARGRAATTVHHW